jgi:hypothetical protein
MGGTPDTTKTSKHRLAQSGSGPAIQGFLPFLAAAQARDVTHHCMSWRTEFTHCMGTWVRSGSSHFSLGLITDNTCEVTS